MPKAFTRFRIRPVAGGGMAVGSSQSGQFNSPTLGVSRGAGDCKAALTDVAIRKAKPGLKPVNLSDGGGMHVPVILVVPADAAREGLHFASAAWMWGRLQTGTTPP